MPNTQQPNHSQLLSETVAFVKGSMFVAMPAAVVSYDEATQTCSVQPAINAKRRVPGSEVLQAVQFPVVPNVPVQWPRGTGWSFHATLVPGDRVMLLASDRSLDEWKQGAPAPHSAPDIRRFDVTDCVAIPGVYPPTDPIPETNRATGAVVLSGTDIRLGDASAQPLALHAALNAFLSQLKTWLDTHTHSDPVSGAVSPPPVPSPGLPSFATTRVKGV